MSDGRIFHLGDDRRVREQLAAAWQQPILSALQLPLQSGDRIVVEAGADHSGRAGVPGGNAFSACRVWKDTRGVAVFVVVRSDDPVGAALARFVLADGVIPCDAGGRLDLAQVGSGPRQSPAIHRKIDDLLRRLEAGMAGQAEKASSALQQLLRLEREDSLLTRLQDPETGLFDGPYASLKLDEEFRRARRFHMPLSLVLLDLGPGGLPPVGPERRALLAEAASVFLNESRDIDVLARFTETIFLFLLPGTPPDGAAVLARRMLKSLSEREFSGGSRLQPVAGLASIPHTGIPDRKAFLAVAEACLARARTGGGDGGLATSWE